MTKTPEHARNHLRKTNVEESISVPMQFTFILGEIISQSCTFKTKCLSRVVGAFCVPRKRVKNTVALHPGVEQLNRIDATAADCMQIMDFGSQEASTIKHGFISFRIQDA